MDVVRVAKQIQGVLLGELFQEVQSMFRKVQQHGIPCCIQFYVRPLEPELSKFLSEFHRRDAARLQLIEEGFLFGL